MKLDISISVKNYLVGQKKPNKQTNKQTNKWWNFAVIVYLNIWSIFRHNHFLQAVPNYHNIRQILENQSNRNYIYEYVLNMETFSDIFKKKIPWKKPLNCETIPNSNKPWAKTRSYATRQSIFYSIGNRAYLFIFYSIGNRAYFLIWTNLNPKLLCTKLDWIRTRLFSNAVNLFYFNRHYPLSKRALFFIRT